MQATTKRKLTFFCSVCALMYLQPCALSGQKSDPPVSERARAKISLGAPEFSGTETLNSNLKLMPLDGQRDLPKKVFLLLASALLSPTNEPYAVPLEQANAGLCSDSGLPLKELSIGRGCSAFFWLKSTNGGSIFLTAEHCLKALLGIHDASQYLPDSLSLYNSTARTSFKVQSVGRLPSLDIAFLRVADKVSQDFQIDGGRLPLQGEDVYVIGNSLGLVQPYFSKGKIRKDEGSGNSELIIDKAVSFSGSSGGPIVRENNGKFEVLGVITRGSAALSIRRELEVEIGDVKSRLPADHCAMPATAKEPQTLFVSLDEIRDKLPK